MEEGDDPGELDLELAALFQHYLHVAEQSSVRDSGIIASSDTSSNCSSLQQPLSPWERLVRTHSIWFLPALTQEEATSILHNKEPGNFLVRRSLHFHSTLSVKLGCQDFFVVQNYDILETGCRMVLKGSDIRFDNILSLVFHYMNVSGELPVRLTMPEILRETEGRQHLSSLAKLGKDFWRYPMSQPGRRSQLILSPPTDIANNQNTFQQDLSHPTQARLIPLSLSPPTTRRRSILSVLTAAPTSHIGPQRHSLPVVQYDREKVEQRLAEHNKNEDMNDKSMDTTIYFKNAPEDKMSDYEDIWERTPGPESPSTGFISPTQSEQKFRDYLFSKFSTSSAGEAPCSPSSIPADDLVSLLSCSSASPLSSSPSIEECELTSTDEESDEEEREEENTLDPLASLERLTEMRFDESDEQDLLEHFSCSEELEEFEAEAVIQKVQAIEQKVRRSDTMEDGRKSALRDTLEKHDDSEQESEESKVGLLLRKLSLRRSGSCSSSRRKSSKKQPDRRLSDIIGCYLGRKGPTCQVDSSSWEFLDHNPRMTPPSQQEVPAEDPVRRQILLNSEAAEIGGERGGCLQELDKTDSLEEGSVPGVVREGSGTSTSRDSVYQTDYSSNNMTGQSSSCEAEEVERAGELLENKEDRVKLPSISRNSVAPGNKVLKDYLMGLTEHQDSLFGLTIQQFIACTRESTAMEPSIVMRNMRQVMNGLKNYTVITGEGELSTLIQREREKLQPDKFFNIDTVLEDVMQSLIILPLKDHLKKVFLEDFTSSGCLQLVAENINFSLSHSSADFCVPAQFLPGLRDTVELCRRNFQQMSLLYSPSAKLDLLLQTVSVILSSATSSSPVSVPSFCSLLSYLIVQTGVETLEIESEWMWGLLHPSLLAGQGGHYLSLLSSSLHLLKNVRAVLGNQMSSGSQKVSSPLLSPTISVLVPNEETGSIGHRSVPLRPQMTARDVSRYVANRLNITNPEDFGLYSLIDGKDTLLSDELQLRRLQEKLQESGQGVTFVYRRSDSNIVLPVQLCL